jgi:3-deoxy-manno-octulosonate cytidylyltransferase (CMP-KDO synthetase)
MPSWKLPELDQRMSFTVLIPARLASTRLPNKPLADICGTPMIVRVSRQMDALRSQGVRVVVVADAKSIVDACRHHGVEAILTSVKHPSGTDRLAEACEVLQLCPNDIVVNVQGDEPLMPHQLVEEVARALQTNVDARMATAAHPIQEFKELGNPNVVKVVLNRKGEGMYFSRAPIPWWRDGYGKGNEVFPPSGSPLRHIGIYAYRVGFLKEFPLLPQAPLEQIEALEQLRVLWNGYSIAVHVTKESPGPGVDTQEDLEKVRYLVAQKGSLQ